MPTWRDAIMSAFPRKKRRDLHFINLDHDQRVHVCKEVAKLPIRLNAVMSNKTTIPAHPRKDLFEKKNTLYWYLCRYAVERVSDYCKRKAQSNSGGNGTAKLIFSRRGGMDYGDFKNYLFRLKRQQEEGSIDTTIKWEAIDIDAVEALDHANRAGLQIADAAASAFNRAVNPDFYGNHESRYGKLLADRVMFSNDGNYFNYGVKPVPGLNQMALTAEQRELFDFYRKRRAGP